MPLASPQLITRTWLITPQTWPKQPKGAVGVDVMVDMVAVGAVVEVAGLETHSVHRPPQLYLPARRPLLTADGTW